LSRKLVDFGLFGLEFRVYAACRLKTELRTLQKESAPKADRWSNSAFTFGAYGQVNGCWHASVTWGVGQAVLNG
jgi:hypothetical protein